MKIRQFLLLCVVLVSLWTVGCAPARSGMDYLTRGGYGEVSGRMSGVAFSAVVELSENGECVRVEYLSPESLCGLTLASDGQTCRVRLGEMELVCAASEMTGFLRPATAFLLYGDANRVQKEGETTVLTFPSGSTLTLSSKGEPLLLVREDIEMRVVWWQSGASTNCGS